MRRRRTLLVEPFAGSAAVSWYLLGNDSPLTGYQGGKGTQARAIARHLGLYDTPDEVLLNDAGPYGRVWTLAGTDDWGHPTHMVECYRDGWDPEEGHALDPEARRAEDLWPCPHIAYLTIKGRPVPRDPCAAAAAFLALQATNFRHKAVQESGGRWVTHGYSKTFGEGLESTDRFGGVRPQLDRLVERLVGAQHLDRITGRHGCALSLPVVQATDSLRVVALIDPPYVGTEGYGDHDLDREAVLGLADRWRSAGAEVAICEGEPVGGRGWTHLQLTAPTRSKGLAQDGAAGRQEWLSLAQPPAQPSLFGLARGGARV